MCGIVGAVAFGSGQPIERSSLRRMARTLAHRGPDDSGEEVFADGHAGLAFRRLSIIDLSFNGHQPMYDASRSTCIVFNGEIYEFRALRAELEQRGHQFRSQSDTEVVLHAYREWGTRCLDRLNGMFAFAIWDERSQQLFVARDRFGIKPLYFTADAGRFVCASEIKALLELEGLSRELNPHAIWSYLTLLQIPAPESIYTSIRKLPPAHAMVIERSGSMSTWQYWRPDLTEQDLSEADVVERVRTLLEAAVQRHLVADVPVGVFLSGGIDSSAIVAYASRLRGEPVDTFSVSFAGHDNLDEAPFQRLVVDRYRPRHREFRVTTDLLAASRLLLKESDEPFAISSAIPLYYISRSASDHVKVVLSGDGGDELFGGYEGRYRIADRVGTLDRVPRAARRPMAMASALVPDALTRYRWPRRLKKMLSLLRYSSDERYIYSFGVFGADEKEALLAPDVLDAIERTLGHGYEKGFAEAPAERPGRYFYTDLVTALSDEMLTKVDRCTSMVSIEGRVPFLDRELAEFALSIPTRYKYANGVGKVVLRKALEPLLPAEVLWAPKRGFNVPMDAWIQEALPAVRRELCDEPSPTFACIFRRDAIERLLALHEKHNPRMGHHIWALLQFNEWCRISGAAMPSGRAS